MPLTPEQIAKIRQKKEETPEALKRDPFSKYTEGWFHVTLNVHGEAPVLGYITGNAEAADGTPDEPRCVLTELGKKVEEVWSTVADFHPMCICDKVKAMPDHIHALLYLLPGNTEHLGRIINGLMIGCTHCYWDTLGIPWRKMRAEKDAAAWNRDLDRAFYAVAEARRLEVSPWEYEYRRREMRPIKDKQGNPVLDVNGKPDMEEVPDISRETCMVMNELVRVIAKRADDWWRG